MNSRNDAKPQRGFFCASVPLRAKKQITHTKGLKGLSNFFSPAYRRPFLLGEKKKKLARKGAKTRRVFLCTPKIKFTKSLLI